jgi:ribosomal protein S19
MYDPDQQVATIEDVNKIVEDAIKRHNRNATIISACLGFTVMAFYAHGVFMIAK